MTTTQERPKRGQDLPTARAMASAMAIVDAIKTDSSRLGDGIAESMLQTLSLIESGHELIDLIEANCESLWHHFDGLRDQHRRCRGLEGLGQAIAVEAANTEDIHNLSIADLLPEREISDDEIVEALADPES